jgi:hypothetical protein
MFTRICAFARNQRKYILQKSLDTHEPCEYMDINERMMLPTILTADEKKFCHYMESKTPVFEILFHENISFQQYRKIRYRLKNKLAPFVSYNDSDHVVRLLKNY